MFSRVLNSVKSILVSRVFWCVFGFSIVILVPVWLGAYVFLSNKLEKDDVWKDRVSLFASFKKVKVLALLESHPIIQYYLDGKLLKSNILPQVYVNQVYELLAFVDYVFTKRNIQWSIDWGTEMGAIRHGGLIPWDDDVDIVMIDDYSVEDIKKIFDEEIKVEPENAKGYETYQHWLTKLWTNNGVQLDVFPTLKPCYKKYFKKEKYGYSFKEGCDFKFRKMAFEKDDILPLKQCDFGPLKLPCKNNVDKPFDVYYGSDWREIAYIGNHTFNKHRDRKLDLKKHPELLKSALPDNDAWKKWVDKKEEWLKKHGKEQKK